MPLENGTRRTFAEIVNEEALGRLCQFTDVTNREVMDWPAAWDFWLTPLSSIIRPGRQTPEQKSPGSAED